MAQVKMMTRFVQSSFYHRKKGPSSKPILSASWFGQLKTGRNKVGSKKLSLTTSSFIPITLPTRKLILGNVSGSWTIMFSSYILLYILFFHLLLVWIGLDLYSRDLVTRFWYFWKVAGSLGDGA